MKRINFCADVHLGNHRRFGGPTTSGLNVRFQIAQRALANARKAHPGWFFILGDLMDTADPLPQMLTSAGSVLTGSEVMLVGNHDKVSDEPGDHALGPFASRCEVVEKPTMMVFDDCEVVLVPFRSGPAKEWFTAAAKAAVANRKAMVEKPGKPEARVLVFHLGIADSRTPVFLKDCHDAATVEHVREVCLEIGAGFALAGNWHGRKFWEGDGKPEHPTILQLGALVPTGFDNPGWGGYGTLAFLGDNPRASEVQLDWVEIPGPRFLTCTGLDGLRTRLGEAKANPTTNPFIEVMVGPENVVEATALLEKAQKVRDITGWSLALDRAEEKAAARTAAVAAAGADTVEEAIQKYVAESTYEGDRAALYATVRGYLGT